MMNFKAQWIIGVVVVVVFTGTTSAAIDPARILNESCTRSYEFCDRQASCVQLGKDKVYCRCPKENDPGDGLKNGTGCKIVDYSCIPQNVRNDCHRNAECINNTCRCKPGYQGNGKVCEDIDECLNKSVCHPNATCQDNPGSYTCTCDKGFVGDGVNCSYHCSTNYDCHVNARCNIDEKCVCKDGYVGDGIKECSDIDECALGKDNCDTNAMCNNTVGSFQCQCKNGFSGNGVRCRVLPKTCDEVLKLHPYSKSGKYEIDTDGTGPANRIEASCLMENGIGITVFWPKKDGDGAVADGRRIVDYYALPNQIEPLVNNSKFCYQEVWFKCPAKYDLLDKVTWTDYYGNDHASWGSVVDNSCACGVVGKCKGGKKCECDGSNYWSKEDFGKLTSDLFSLPVKSVNFKNSQTSASFKIGPLKCGPRHFDLPKNCHEAKKKMRISTNQPLLIDADGPTGSLLPFLVFCDMKTYRNFGLTVVPHDLKPGTEPTTSGKIPLKYPAKPDQVNALVKGSVFCSQTVEYECKNAPPGTFEGGANSSPLKYFPGGASDVPGSCACGLTGSCDVPAKQCNCDITDGKKRKDIGLVIDKDVLPLVSMTVSVGGDKYAKLTVGELKCSEQQFEIEPNCEKLRGLGTTYSYTYMIDPDGIGGEPPFPAQCLMMTSPPQGATVINHAVQHLGQFTLAFFYKRVSNEQISGLKKRSTYCAQAVSLTCKKFAIHPRNGKSGYWLTLEGQKKYYFTGDGVKSNCSTDTGMCECDKAAASFSPVSDKGELMNLKDLPVAKMNLDDAYNGFGNVDFTVGPLTCYETFPTCSQLYYSSMKNARKGEKMVTSGQFTIDPDQLGKEKPFQVTCSFPLTRVSLSSDPPSGLIRTGKHKCHKITYKDGAGNPLTKGQIQALLDQSASCNQYLSYTSNNAPLTGNVYYSKCDGDKLTKIPGWAGSEGFDKCQCGVTGTCDGGVDMPCSTDNEDNEQHADGSFITNKNYLPVCEVCVNVPGINSSSPVRYRVGVYSLGDLYCNGYSMGTKSSCTDFNLHKNSGGSSNILIDIDGKLSGEPQFPVYCEISPYPDMGVMIFKPQKPKIDIPKDTFFNFTVTYMVYKKYLMEKLIDRSEYCEQEIALVCKDSGVTLSGKFGWYSRNNKVMPYWTTGKNPCDGDGSNCQCNKPGTQTDSGLITNKADIPVSRVVLPPAKGDRELHIGEVRCYDIYKDCYSIMVKGQIHNTPYRSNSTYVIDPDSAGGVKPFLAKCEFHKDDEYAVTEIIYKGNPVTVIKKSTKPLEFEVPITYPASSPEQSNALAKHSQFCSQGVLYECIQSPLTNNNNPAESRIDLFGKNTTTFGKGRDTKSIGCPCSIVGTCNLDGKGSESSTCRCDNMGYMTFDNGTVTDKDYLPVVGGAFGGQTSDDSVGKFTLGPMKCANKPFGIPRDCEEAQSWGYKSGEYLILPKPYFNEPFYVFCDMDINPGHGIIRVLPEAKKGIPVDGSSVHIKYKGPTPDQLEAIVRISKFCYQPVKFSCIGTEFFGDGAATWSGPSGSLNTNFGRASSMQCSCGHDHFCGGYDGKTKMRARKCNCDLGDQELRADAGVISTKEALPLTSLDFNRWVSSASANLTVGNLYCGEEEFDLNECQLGFHDCHELADCRNTKSGYDCVCKRGYRGKINGVSTEKVWANGRQCIDDDECSYNKCPSSAYCTNLPGTYKCTCKPGFRQIGFDVCEDINECLDPKLNDCDVNARCDNFEGGYSCACNRGFRDSGNGTKGDCEPQGLCACYGDPHCISFDTKFLDFQGYCTYVMSQDGCTGKPRTYQILINTWNQDKPGISSVSWVKSVILRVKGLEFEIRQSKEILLNATVISGYDDHGIIIANTGLRVKVYTDFGLQITWNGLSEVEVIVPKNYQSQTCGLCGNFNFNASDDWTIGPECPQPGTVTTNPNTFGHSWVVPSSLNDPNNRMCYKKCDEKTTHPECKMDLKRVHGICGAVFDKEKSPFKDCLMKMNQTIVEKMRKDCYYDMCEVPGDVSIAQCSAANRLVTECAKIGEQAPQWRNHPGIYCGMKCGKNMRYSECGGLNTTDPGPILTCQDLTSSRGPKPLDKCIESCFCDEGYVLDGDKCIPQKECGCSEGGTYMSAGQVIVAEDCSYVRECKADGHIFTKTSLACHVNATCSVDAKTGVHGCHCKKGFIGDGVTSCREDPCADVKCNDPKTMECVDGECRCIMGYTGDCQRCFDVDECLTDTHNCVHVGQVCKNTPGSFVCQCMDGFLPVAGYCADIDECDENKKTPGFCSVNSECRNKPGGYDCVCCGGYKKGPDGCVLDGSGDNLVGDKHKCCSCYGEACKEIGPVCGTDGKTYSSMKSLIIRRCKEGNTNVGLSNKGPCPATCAELDCEKKHKYMKCEVEPETNRAVCKCPECSSSETESETESVCTSKKVKFASKCVFKKFACEVGDSEITIVPTNSSDCGPGPGVGEPVGGYGPWSECDKCGMGNQTRVGKYLNLKDKDGNPFTFTEQRVCYRLCNNTPCREGVCSAPKVCVFDEKNGTSCICPECKGWGSNPICTKRGRILMTYENDCLRRKDACLLNEDIEVIQNFPCGHKPRNCSKMMNFISKTDPDACFSQVFDFGKCAGGCGRDPEDCCQEVYEEKEVDYFCGVDSIKRKKKVVVDCKCISFEELVKKRGA